MLIFSTSSKRRPTLLGSLLMEVAKLRKMIKTVVKKQNQNNVKTRKLHQETVELFLKNVAQCLVQKQVLPKTWGS